MNILEKIISIKKTEVENRKRKMPLRSLCEMPYYSREIISLVDTLSFPGASGVIAEFKRCSPSKGMINEHADPVFVTNAYQEAGVSGISILTDESFFKGANLDLLAARPQLHIPILRKDFTIDEYQIHEAKALGADVILLIAACLSPEMVHHLASVAHSLCLEVLLELHDEWEMNHLCDAVDLVGINNRSLKTFDVDIERSLKMANHLPAKFLKVAESGIENPLQIKKFREQGYHGFLIGESFMRHLDPRPVLKDFMNKIGKE